MPSMLGLEAAGALAMVKGWRRFAVVFILFYLVYFFNFRSDSIFIVISHFFQDLDLIKIQKIIKCETITRGA